MGKKATLTNPSVGRLTLDPGWMHDTGLFIAKPATPGALRDFSITVKIEGKGEVGVGVGGGGLGRPGGGGGSGGVKGLPATLRQRRALSVQQQTRRHR